MTITIATSSGSSVTDDSELQAVVANVSRNDCTVWTVFMGYTNPCAIYCLVFRVSRWLSSTVVHALANELIVLGWFNSRVAPALAPFLAISPLVKLLAKLLVQSNG